LDFVCPFFSIKKKLLKLASAKALFIAFSSIKRTPFTYWSFSENVFGPASHFIIKRR